MFFYQGQQREHHDTLLKRNEELKQRINAIKAERAQQEPEILKVQYRGLRL